MMEVKTIIYGQTKVIFTLSFMYLLLMAGLVAVAEQTVTGCYWLKKGSSGKRVPVCYYHHSVVHQIPFARHMAYFFCLSNLLRCSAAPNGEQHACAYLSR